MACGGGGGGWSGQRYQEVQQIQVYPSADWVLGLEWDAELECGCQAPGNGCLEKGGPLVSERVGSRPQPC